MLIDHLPKFYLNRSEETQTVPLYVQLACCWAREFHLPFIRNTLFSKGLLYEKKRDAIIRSFE